MDEPDSISIDLLNKWLRYRRRVRCTQRKNHTMNLPPPSFMQVFQLVQNPPTIQNPPPGWETALVPSGSWFPFYAYEEFEDQRDPSTGVVIGRILSWKRAAFFLPSQTFDLMALQSDNTWACVGEVQGPLGYFDMDLLDGEVRDGISQVQRLRAQ